MKTILLIILLSSVFCLESLGHVELGFFEEDSVKTEGGFAESMIGSILNKNKIKATIRVKIYCSYVNSPYPIYINPGVDIHWSIDSDSRKNELSGDVQTKTEGFVDINIYSFKTVRNKIFVLKFNDYEKRIILGSGPYILNVPESACRRIKI